MNQIRNFNLWLLLSIIAIGVLTGVGAYTFIYARGYSYIFNDPEICVNCHIMRENYDSWIVSPHRSATCNDCHVPHHLIGKYIAKADNGFRHSYAFTFKNVQVLTITERNLRYIQQNCIRCHQNIAHSMFQESPVSLKSCTRCHRDVGHSGHSL
ncbi:MAG: cytochrome c nitrite reductase small subunit [bacterium]|nr:cytochrome c nitrite reductase small subunit [bacterium]